MSNKRWKMGQILVVFSEYLNFKYIHRVIQIIGSIYMHIFTINYEIPCCKFMAWHAGSQNNNKSLCSRRTWLDLLALVCHSPSKLWNQVPFLDLFVIQNSVDFLCWKYKEVVCFYVSNWSKKGTWFHSFG